MQDGSSGGGAARWRRWALLAAITLIAILTPFYFFEADMTAFVERMVRPDTRSGAIAASVILLLALDVVLPVPSSLVMTAAGAALGFLPGLAASAAGMTLGSVLGYVCGRQWGLPLVRRIAGERELAYVSKRFQRGAGWALAAMRPVPVLAEASSLFAGVAGVPVAEYLRVTTLANIGISGLYCFAGAQAWQTSSFLLAFAASVGLPGLAMAAAGVLRRRRS